MYLSVIGTMLFVECLLLLSKPCVVSMLLNMIKHCRSIIIIFFCGLYVGESKNDEINTYQGSLW